MPNNYTKWINANKESLIDQWEAGFTVCGDVIEQKTYEDFVAFIWGIESKIMKRKVINNTYFRAEMTQTKERQSWVLSRKH